MAHKTLIDGTYYEITGGKALVGGTAGATAYDIKSGRTLIDGVGYNISFLMEFKINSNTHGTRTLVAPIDITWGDFIDSEYNNDPITGRKFNLNAYGTGAVLYNNAYGVTPSCYSQDIIVEGQTYTVID